MSEQTRNTYKLALIYGSTREGRRCAAVAKWAVRSASAWGGFEVDAIDPLELGLPAHHREEDGPALQALQRRLDQADAFVVVTPEYNHSYPAALKFLIDSVFGAWQAKPVAFVSYGGISGGLRAVEHLRQVFAELHAVGVRDAVSFANVWDFIDEDTGELQPPGAADAAMARMLKRLHWWAEALGEARTARPYQHAA